MPSTKQNRLSSRSPFHKLAAASSGCFLSFFECCAAGEANLALVNTEALDDHFVTQLADVFGLVDAEVCELYRLCDLYLDPAPECLGIFFDSGELYIFHMIFQP